MPATGSTSPIRSLQARSAAARRWHSEDSEALARDYAAARLEDYIRRTVDAAPPLTDEQKQRLAGLLLVSAKAG